MIMSYSNIVDNLNCDHRWSFDGDSNDKVGSVNGNSTGVTYVNSAICEDLTYCVTTNSVNDIIKIDPSTDINSSSQPRKIVAGWFETTDIQTPPKMIYGEGGNTVYFHFVMSLGNEVMFEVYDTNNNNFTMQVYGIKLEPNRPYHLCGTFSSSGYSNEINFYIDGIKQLIANPMDRQPDAPYLSSRGYAYFGKPDHTVSLGGVELVQNACVNGKYNQWATWVGSNADLTDDEIREELFEKGAKPHIIISSDTESNMQSDLNSYFNTKFGNYPLCVRVESATDTTGLTLIASGITFDERASIHVQYTGVDTLIWKNDINSNATIFSTTSGGTITVQNETMLVIYNLKYQSEVRIYNSLNNNEICGVENITGGTFSTKIYEELVNIVIVSLNYKIKRLDNVDTTDNKYISITQFKDNIYYNP